MRLHELTPTGLPEQFEEVVMATDWTEGVNISSICGIEGMPWLGISDGVSLKGIVGFSTTDYHGDKLYPPADSLAASDRSDSMLMSFNSDYFSRGIGELIVNHPDHMQPGSMVNGIPVRVLDINRLGIITAADQDKSDRTLFLRHGALTLGSLLGNTLFPPDNGSNLAARAIERRYHNAALVRMPIPPVWRHQQETHNITPQGPGEIMLVRGRQYSKGNVLAYAGVHKPV